MSHPFGSRPHAELGASSAHRWMGCPGSVRLAAGVAAPASTYAEEGAAAHTLAEICLEDSLDALALIGRELNGHIVDAEMADSVQVYLDAVRAELGPGDLLLVEQHFSLDQLDPPGEMFGTADAVVIKPALRRLVVFDLKYGAGVAVEAEGNPQARYYGLGACMEVADRPVTEVEIVIVQPRAPHPSGPIRRETVSAFELVEWSADLLDAAERTLAPDAPLRPCAPANGAGSARRQVSVRLSASARSRPPRSSSPRRRCAGRRIRQASRPARSGGSSRPPSWSSSGSGRSVPMPTPSSRRAGRYRAGSSCRSARPGGGAMKILHRRSSKTSASPRTSYSLGSSGARRRSRSCSARSGSARSQPWSSPRAAAPRSHPRPIHVPRSRLALRPTSPRCRRPCPSEPVEPRRSEMAEKLITPEAMVSYPALFEPKPTPSGELKYSCALVFPEGADLAALKNAALAALEERWGSKARDMLQKKQLKWPFRDGAEKDTQGYGPGTTFINVTSKQQPGVVDRYAGPDGKPRPITDPSEIYPGCFVRASLRPFTYDTNGSKGVSFGLQNLQKLRDGERIDGRMRPEDEFEAIESGAADLDDLLA